MFHSFSRFIYVPTLSHATNVTAINFSHNSHTLNLVDAWGQSSQADFVHSKVLFSLHNLHIHRWVGEQQHINSVPPVEGRRYFAQNGMYNRSSDKSFFPKSDTELKNTCRARHVLSQCRDKIVMTSSLSFRFAPWSIEFVWNIGNKLIVICWDRNPLRMLYRVTWINWICWDGRWPLFRITDYSGIILLLRILDG